VKSLAQTLPAGWEVSALSEVATVIQGQSPPGSTYNIDDKGLPFFQGKAEFTDLSPVASKWCTEPNKIAEPGDVLISVRAPVGPTNLANVTCCIGRGLAAIRPAGGIPTKFLLYYLRYSESDLAGKGIGTTFSAITGDDLREHRVVVPPLAEQSRIVATIETQLTRLDAAVAALERVRANLKRYRASVLKAAVEGRLVPTEAELARKEERDYEPASVLLDSILAERRRRWEESELARMKAAGKPPKEDGWKSKYKEPAAPDTSTLPQLPEGWCWATLDALASIVGGVTKGQKRKPTDQLRRVPYLRVAERDSISRRVR
jgi:type I restriction enzyme, S subunit